MNVSRIAVAIAAAALVGDLAFGQITTRVSVNSSGVEGDAWSDWIAVSGDGHLVAFTSYATNLVDGDTNGFPDLFVHDRTSGSTRRMSLGVGGVEPNNWVGSTAISADGRFIAVDTLADNFILGDANGTEDVFVVDVQSGAIVLASVGSDGSQGNGASGDSAFSSDGRLVAFVSDASNLVAGDTNGARDIFVRDVLAGTTERVSVDDAGAQGNGSSDSPSVSADGRYVAFHSLASNLVGNDGNGHFDIFVRDRTTGTTVCASVDPNDVPGNGNSSWPSISRDGRFVAFDSDTSNLVAGDVNGVRDIFVRDLMNGSTALVSVDSAGNQGNLDSAEKLAISGDGSRVAFLSSASNLAPGDGNGQPDIFIHDLASGATTRVSVASDGTEGNGVARRCAISDDGSTIVFNSTSSNLVAGDSNAADDIFVSQSCDLDASWCNYGTGFPGTNGVPSLTAQSNPVFGSSLTVDLASSSNLYTAAVLFVGFQQAQIHSAWGGDLLLLPAIASLIALPPMGTSLTGDLPDDEAFCGFEVDLQAIEADAGAAKGVSFTPGLQLILGH
jgi:Tol biopolymer transport system component